PKSPPQRKALNSIRIKFKKSGICRAFFYIRLILAVFRSKDSGNRRYFMKRILCSLALLLTFFPAGYAAASVVEPDYDPSKPPVLTPWFGNVGAAERKADLDFIAGMR